MKVLFYIDSVIAYSNGVTAAEMLRRKLDAQIVMMCVDSQKYLNATTRAYEFYDYSSLVRPLLGFVRVWPHGDAPRPSIISEWLRVLRGVARSIRARIRRQLRRLKIMLPRSIRVRTRRQLRRQSRQLRRLKRMLAPVLVAVVPLMLVSRFVATVLYWLAPVLRLLVTYRTIGQFLELVEPDVIILAEENVETLSSAFVSQGSRRGIPTIILPFTLPNPLEPAQFYKESADHRARGLLAGILCFFWPKWRFTYEGLEMLRLPARTALVAEMLRVSSPDPWVLNRGRAAAIALDSHAQREQYLRLGFPPKQLHVVGDAHADTLYNASSNQKELLASLAGVHGFDPAKPLVLCGFPPDQFNSHDPTGFEFENYSSLVAAWASVFRELKDHANFLIRPHPRSSTQQIELFRSQELQISMQPTAELIPLCDIYLASISATIRWAIACGIPVVNYDTYRYRYDDFTSVPGVLHVETIDDFRGTLCRLLTDVAFAAEARSKQRASMQYWGFCDGKTSDRLAAVALDAVGAARRLSGS